MDLALTKPNDALENRLLSIKPEDLVAQGGRAQAGFERVVGLGGVPPVVLLRASIGAKRSLEHIVSVNSWISGSGRCYGVGLWARPTFALLVPPDAPHPRRQESDYKHRTWASDSASSVHVLDPQEFCSLLRECCGARRTRRYGGLLDGGCAPSFSALCGTWHVLTSRASGVPCNSIQTTLGLSWLQQFFTKPFSSEEFLCRVKGFGGPIATVFT
ncbi:hypothetical protein C8R47DRAFT_111746 [Mycena vitilis]|nr:hypothetical protein C8R47DRAFT_111746 [Mycena vitilis]